MKKRLDLMKEKYDESPLELTLDMNRMEKMIILKDQF